ncbi:MAG TPA: hypothetical protein VGG75_42985 [Trebonia sp.]|jgi:hypothetical protein
MPAAVAEVIALEHHGVGAASADPSAILFIDDSARSVAATRDTGLAAEQWTFADGHAVLLAILGQHGIGVTE